jgi:phosphoesterase RecJ-like protein
MGKEVSVVLHDPPDDHYAFLGGWDAIQWAAPPHPAKADCAVIIDCPTLERIGDVVARIGDGTRVLSIDHHQDNSGFGEVNLVSPAASSSCELIFHLATSMRLEIDARIAAQLYTGILFDTGGFRYSLTTPTTFEVAAALVRRGIRLDRIADRVFGNRSFAEVKQRGKAIESLELRFDGRVASLHLDNAEMAAGDPDQVVNYGLLVRGVEVAFLLKEQEPGKYRISLRSRDRVDVSRIAARFSGGGHARASGCRLEGTREEVEQALLDAIGKHLN